MRLSPNFARQPFSFSRFSSCPPARPPSLARASAGRRDNNSPWRPSLRSLTSVSYTAIVIKYRDTTTLKPYHHHVDTRPPRHRHLPLSHSWRCPSWSRLCLSSHRSTFQRQCRNCQCRRMHCYRGHMVILVLCLDASMASVD